MSAIPATRAPDAVSQSPRVGWDAGYLFAAIVVALTFVTQAFAIVQGTRAWLVHQVPDDAYYYFEIGRRIADGQGPTFDGVTRTDGFHPAWQVVVAAISLVASGDTAVRVALLLCLILFLSALWMTFTIVARFAGTGPPAAGILTVVHSPATMRAEVNGMESALSVASLALLLVVYGRAERERRVLDAVLLGAVSGLVVLSRLDFAAVIPLVGAVLWVRTRSTVLVVTWAAATALAGAPFVLWNWLQFGHLSTVSATVKLTEMNDSIARLCGSRFSTCYADFLGTLGSNFLSALFRQTFAGVLFEPRNLAQYLVAYAIPLLAAVGLAVLVARLARAAGGRPALTPAHVAVFLGVALALLREAVVFVEIPVQLGNWYSVSDRIVLGFGAGALAWWCLQRLWHRSRWAAALPIALAVLVVPPLNWYVAATAPQETLSPGGWQDTALRTMEWIERHGPQGRYGSPDAGLLGFYLHGTRTVVDLDGLVNDFWFVPYATGRRPALDAYRRLHVAFLVGRLPLARRTPFPCARTTWQYPKILRLPSSLTGYGPYRYGVWNLQPCFRR